MIEGSLRNLYATPLVEVRVEQSAELNRRLKTIILEKEAGERGMARSNVGGWHSPADLFDWPHEEIRVLKAAVIELVMQTTKAISPGLGDFECKLGLTAWANVSRCGDYNTVHNHPGFHWSGSYYVSAGAPDPHSGRAGCIEFRDPRVGVNMVSAPGDPFGQSVAVTPAEGMLLLFPAWLEHFVHPHAGSEPRISIAFNALLVRPS
jgi:uncharacterized protein (TIGR02466 family)